MFTVKEQIGIVTEQIAISKEQRWIAKEQRWIAKEQRWIAKEWVSLSPVAKFRRLQPVKNISVVLGGEVLVLQSNIPPTTLPIRGVVLKDIHYARHPVLES
ncbi:hypothetical protein CDAR_497661 [Caerostris darwini]|uniref:Uncharacterized protein n=1 Tax=Caerostris darwini TaxID=1538125 RepID=A0AAV4PSI2_9ARAC|nr:hypothetical protein CDAR_497661 [Caerostris darwini]